MKKEFLYSYTSFLMLMILSNMSILTMDLSKQLPAPLQLPPYNPRGIFKDVVSGSEQDSTTITELNKAASMLLFQEQLYRVGHIYQTSIDTAQTHNTKVVYGEKTTDGKDDFLGKIKSIGINTQDPEVASALLLFLKQLEHPQSPFLSPCAGEENVFCRAVNIQKNYLSDLLRHSNPNVVKAAQELERVYCAQTGEQMLMLQAVSWYTNARFCYLNLLLKCITGVDKPLQVPKPLENDFKITVEPLQQYAASHNVIMRCIEGSPQENGRLIKRTYDALLNFCDYYRGVRSEAAKVYQRMAEFLRAKHGRVYTQSGLFLAGLRTADDKPLPDVFGGLLPKEFSHALVSSPAEIIGYKEPIMPKEAVEPPQPKNRVRHKPKTNTRAAAPKKVTAPLPEEPVISGEKSRRPRSKIKAVVDAQQGIDLGFFNALKQEPQERKVVNWRYAPRISEWFEDKDKALENQGYNDPNNHKHYYRETAHLFHGFTLAADKWVKKYGRQFTRKKDGKDQCVIMVPGYLKHERVNEGALTYGLYCYVIDDTGECYHRCFEPRTLNALISLFTDTSNWEAILNQLDV